jgi:hypothetical protein
MWAVLKVDVTSEICTTYIHIRITALTWQYTRDDAAARISLFLGSILFYSLLNFPHLLGRSLCTKPSFFLSVAESVWWPQSLVLLIPDYIYEEIRYLDQSFDHRASTAQDRTDRTEQESDCEEHLARVLSVRPDTSDSLVQQKCNNRQEPSNRQYQLFLTSYTYMFQSWDLGHLTRCNRYVENSCESH